jgi:hypothetical protein
LKLSAIAVALKTNLDVIVDPQESSNLLKTYDVGLVQVGHLGEEGRARIKKVFNWLTISILPGPRKSTEWYLNVVFNPIVHISDADLRNPASPHACHSPITCKARESESSATPTISSTPISTQIMSQDQGSSLGHSPTSTLPSSLPPIIISPTRAGSIPDLLSTHEVLQSRESSERKLSSARSVTSFAGSSSVHSSSFSSFISGKDSSLNVTENGVTENGHIDHPVSKEKEPWVICNHSN